MASFNPGLAAALSEAESDSFEEVLVDLPPCPVCQQGKLLPVSSERTPFALWVCSAPTCTYTISCSESAWTYYKGTAAAKEKEKGGKKWTEYSF